MGSGCGSFTSLDAPSISSPAIDILKVAVRERRGVALVSCDVT